LEASLAAREQGSYVVWGGPHPTLFPRQTLEQSPAHAVVPGFGYAGLRLLLDRLTGGDRAPGPAARVLTETGDLPGVEGCPQVGASTGRAGALVDAVDAEPDLDVIGDWEPYVNADWR